MRTWNGNLAFLKYCTANQSCVTKYWETHLSHSYRWLQRQSVSPPSTSNCVAHWGKIARKKTQIKIEEQTVLSSDNSWSSPHHRPNKLNIQQHDERPVRPTYTPPTSFFPAACSTGSATPRLTTPISQSAELPKSRMWGNVRYYPLTALRNSWACVRGNPLREEEGCLNRKQNTVCLLCPLLLIIKMEFEQGGHLAGVIHAGGQACAL